METHLFEYSLTLLPRRAGGIEAEFRIAELLGIEINCVECFKEKAGF